MKTKPQIIAEQIPEAAMVVVDVGCSQLENNFLLKEGRKVYGVDIVPRDIPGYERCFAVDLNANPLPFADGSVDAVAMGCVLAHVAAPLKVLADINRVLPIGGTLVLSTPNPNYYWETVLNVFYHHFKGRVCRAKHGEHFCSFSRYTMRTSAERMGFEVVREVGNMFAVVKTPIRFNPPAALAYEIVYVMRKVGEPRQYVTYDGQNGEERITTRLT